MKIFENVLNKIPRIVDVSPLLVVSSSATLAIGHSSWVYVRLKYLHILNGYHNSVLTVTLIRIIIMASKSYYLRSHGNRLVIKLLSM